MTREWRQPKPAWMEQRDSQRRVDAERTFQENVVGNLMDGPAFEEAAPAPAVRPGPQDEHHSIGKDFILAGRAVFTVSGKDKRFTFRVNRKESINPKYPDPTYFISVLTGHGAGEHAYSYVGMLNVRTGGITFTKGSKIQQSAPAAVALRWTLSRIWQGLPLPAPAAIYHEGRCGRCGRPLTVPESILTGYGPDCADLVGKTYVKEHDQDGAQ